MNVILRHVCVVRERLEANEQKAKSTNSILKHIYRVYNLKCLGGDVGVDISRWFQLYIKGGRGNV